MFTAFACFSISFLVPYMWMVIKKYEVKGVEITLKKAASFFPSITVRLKK